MTFPEINPLCFSGGCKNRLCGNLCGQAQHISSLCARWADRISVLTGNSLRNLQSVRRQISQLGMLAWQIIKAATDATDCIVLH